MMNDTRQPIDISAVELPPELAALTERLAENAHEVWAQQRLKEGWSHGSERDDRTKKHPCLIPYAALPESEKDYDRRAALGTLKAILALGYRISKTPVETRAMPPGPFADAPRAAETPR